VYALNECDPRFEAGDSQVCSSCWWEKERFEKDGDLEETVEKREVRSLRSRRSDDLQIAQLAPVLDGLERKVLVDLLKR
jgi:hypothetical protein